MQPQTSVTKTEKKTVQEWISSEQFKESIKKTLPKHLTPDRFIRVALTTLLKTPKLSQCSQQSIFQCMLDLSSWGLEPDGYRCHIIPYGSEAKLIIDYKGLLELGRRSGEIKLWRAELVCEKDEFSYQNGEVFHNIDFRSDRGPINAVYSHIKYINGVDDFEVMTLEEVRQIQNRSKAGKVGPWVTDFNEMAKKTAIRRHSKRAPLSSEFKDALDRDFDSYQEPITFSAEELSPKTISGKSIEDIEDIESESTTYSAAQEVKEEKYVGSKSEEAESVNKQTGEITSSDDDTLSDDIDFYQMQMILDAMESKGVTKNDLDAYLKQNYNHVILTNVPKSEVEKILGFVRSFKKKK